MLIFIIFIGVFTNALQKQRELTYYQSRISIIGIIISIFIVSQSNDIYSLDKGLSICNGLFNISYLTQIFTIFVMLISGIILIFNSFYHRSLIDDYSNITSFKAFINNSLKKSHYNIIMLNDKALNLYLIIEYPLIILFAVCGASFLMCSGDLISLFISIELQSYALYILSSVHRESEQSTWGGLTYFLLGGLSSCFILLGSAFIYINSGQTSLEAIYVISQIGEVQSQKLAITNNLDSSSEMLLHFTPSDFNYYIDQSLILIFVGLLFKISAAPFHFWSPDVYDRLPTHVTTYVAIVAKIAILVLALDLVYYVNGESLSITWKNTLLISSLLSLVIGSLLGLTQFRIKKLLAYSTISHVGFILLALSVNTQESYQATIFYILSYSISNLNLFIIIVTMGYVVYLYIIPNNTANIDYNLTINFKHGLHLNSNHHNHLVKTIDNYTNSDKSLSNPNNILKSHDNNLKDKYNSPLQLVEQLKGFFYINTYLCLSLTITLFSFIGIPPLLGFFAKQMVLSSALDNGYIFLSLTAIITSVCGAVYYLNLVKTMFFFNPDYKLNPYIKRWISKVNYFGSVIKDSNSYYGEITLNKDNSAQQWKSLSINVPLSLTISILSLVLILFIFIPNESFNLAKILSLALFK